MRATRILLVILLFVAGFAVTSETSGESKEKKSTCDGWTGGQGKIKYCCWLQGEAIHCERQ